MGVRGEREGLPSMLATSFAEAAGVARRQKWGLVLSLECGTLSWDRLELWQVRHP